MREAGVATIVFSSTCATCGDPVRVPIDETHPQAPVNPCGESKLMVEKILRCAAARIGLKWIALRYFNAAGADPEGEIGEDHDPETHLIPLVIGAALGHAAARESVRHRLPDAGWLGRPRLRARHGSGRRASTRAGGARQRHCEPGHQPRHGTGTQRAVRDPRPSTASGEEGAVRRGAAARRRSAGAGRRPGPRAGTCSDGPAATPRSTSSSSMPGNGMPAGCDGRLPALRRDVDGAAYHCRIATRWRSSQ